MVGQVLDDIEFRNSLTKYKFLKWDPPLTKEKMGQSVCQKFKV